MSEATVGLEQRRFSVGEYHRMATAGVFAPGERVELIRGVVREMTPRGRRHVLAVARLLKLLAAGLAERAALFVQDPLFDASPHSEPEPDLIVTSDPDPDAYVKGEARSLLVIEVADSSLDHDRSIKAPLYAEAGVPEYWIVDLVADRLEVFREPIDGRYRSVRTYSKNERIRPGAWPDLELLIDELIPPQGLD